MQNRPPAFQAPDSPADRARAGLLDDATRSNREIALAVRTTPRIVQAARHQLTSVGVLPPSPFPRHRPPRFKELPRQPWLAEGACVGRLPSLHTSDDPADRAEAVRVCEQDCPVLIQCQTWSLSLPQSDLAIYGGLNASGRARMRLARLGRPVPLRMTAAGQNAARQRRRHPPAAETA